MPNYDYRCERTGEMFEVWQAFADDPLSVCPQTHAGAAEPCGSAVRKVFSKVGISFKGDGFYTNDHGARSKAPKSGAGSESASDSTGADAGSADTDSCKASSSSSGSGSSGSSAADKSASGSAKPKAAASSGSKAKDSSAA